MNELFPCAIGWHRVEVTVTVTAGAGDMSAAELLEALDQVGDALDRGGAPVAMMATAVTIVVLVQADSPVAALIAGVEAVEAAVAGRRLSVVKSRYVSRAACPVVEAAEATGVLTAGATSY